MATGGTGLTADTTPEALDEIKDKDIQGLENYLINKLQKNRRFNYSIKSNGGFSQRYLCIRFASSSGAVTDAWEDILKFQPDSRFRPCNFIELIKT